MVSARTIWFAGALAGLGGLALLAGLVVVAWPRLELETPRMADHDARFVVRNTGLLPVTDLDISCENDTTRWDVSAASPLFPPLLPLSRTRLDAKRDAVLACALNADDFPVDVHAGYRVLGFYRRAHFRVERFASADDASGYRLVRLSERD